MAPSLTEAKGGEVAAITNQDEWKQALKSPVVSSVTCLTSRCTARLQSCMRLASRLMAWLASCERQSWVLKVVILNEVIWSSVACPRSNALELDPDAALHVPCRSLWTSPPRGAAPAR